MYPLDTKRHPMAKENPNIDAYLIDGCGRCDLYKTPQCKVNQWREELILLREIILESELQEDYKWSQPCYTYQGQNVLMLTALKEYAVLSFFKGTLLKDSGRLLFAPGKHSQAVRQFRFTNTKQITEASALIMAYIQEAIEIEKAGKKVEFKKSPEDLPEELHQKFDLDAEFMKAFYALTPGRQRGYILLFSQPKQSKTRSARIDKYYDQIMLGKGIHDDYRRKNKS